MLASRRQFLTHATSLGSAAFTWLWTRDARAADPVSGPHHAAKVNRVVQIFCPGGVSHVDTFDYKPELEKQHGQPMTGKGKADTFFGQPGNLMKSPFTFKQYGECGRWVSDLLPQLAGHVDDLTFIHSMTARSSNHT